MTQKFQSLGIVSDSDEKVPLVERRRLTRLSLSSDQFRLSQNGKLFSIADLSRGGMALRVLALEDLVWFSVGANISGILNLRREKFHLQAKVRHIGKDQVGCEFVEVDTLLTHALKHYLDPSILGKALKPMPSSEAGKLWYHGPSGTDLIFWRGVDGQYRRFTLFSLGIFVQWDEKEKIKTGHTQSSFEVSEVRGVFHYETMLLEADVKPDFNKLDIAKAVLLSSNLPQDFKKWCFRQLGQLGILED
jgi:hypothetical protein